MAIVTVHPTFNIELSSLLCADDSVLFDGSYYGVGNYEFAYTTQYGCDSVISLTVSKDPLVQIVHDPISFQTNTVYEISSGSPDDGNEYSWQISPNSYDVYMEFGVLAFVTFYDSVEYTITVIGTNSCGSDTASLVIDVSENIGISNAEPTPLSIYPNPVQSILHIEGISEGSFMDAKIYDVVGRVVLVIDDYSNVDVSVLPGGLYFIRLEQNEKGEMLQFIKE